ncbi:hypothetical protein [Actinocorallia aurea]
METIRETAERITADLAALGDPDLWIRRTALLAHIPRARAGTADLPRISAYTGETARPARFGHYRVGQTTRNGRRSLRCPEVPLPSMEG